MPDFKNTESDDDDSDVAQMTVVSSTTTLPSADEASTAPPLERSAIALSARTDKSNDSSNLQSKKRVQEDAVVAKEQASETAKAQKNLPKLLLNSTAANSTNKKQKLLKTGEETETEKRVKKMADACQTILECI